jgi:hypothetical protein
VQGTQPDGIHSIKWDASGIGPGMYFCRMKTPDHVGTLKLLLR